MPNRLTLILEQHIQDMKDGHAKELRKALLERDIDVVADFITVNYGERCKSYNEHCPTCQQWEVFDKWSEERRRLV